MATARQLALATALGVAMSAWAAPIAAAATPVATTRVAGLDRFATAAALSQRAYPAGAAIAYVAAGDSTPDALAGAAAAAHGRGPLLLVDRSGLPAVTAAELGRLRPTSVVVVGGEAAVAPAVAEQIAIINAAAVRRVGGADRYDTAARVSATVFSPGVADVFIAAGTGFADALGAVPAAAKAGAPLLLTGPDALAGPTAAELRRLRPGAITVVGGPAAVPEAVVAELAALTTGAVRRLAGADRYETSAAIAAASFARAPTVYLATGTGVADALAAGPAAAAAGGPVLLVRGNCLTPGAVAELARLEAVEVVLVGGETVLPRTLDRLVGCPGGSQFTLDHDPAATADELAAIFTATAAAQAAMGDSGPLALSVVNRPYEYLAGVLGLARFGTITVFLPRYRELVGRIGPGFVPSFMAHEYFHTRQFSLMVAGGATHEALLYLPVWQVEGPAQYFAAEFDYARLGLDFAQYRRAMVALSKGTRAPLSTIVSSGSLYELADSEARYATIILASGYLVDSYGADALRSAYWTELGAGIPWSLAFERTFGVPVAQFYADFERYRAAL